ncbi:MAG: PLP-dependent aspartate aminotransferase family protein [Chloroflexota bacterium]|jgi:methionine-gamma-lyase|nr:PLP-dependent aspartate aminotransferase family protein [Chloroflexota bacterium]MDH5244484.1 PLP-dependent aspartate aminotransferase family protein [Chloroflexota bacterium]
MRQRTEGRGFATRAIHAGERPDPTTHAHKTPIYATATFAFDTAGEKEDAVDRALAWEPGAYFYSRTGNPTNRALEEKIASLEGAEDAVVSASGMAAVASTLLAHLGSGDHLVVGDELFAITKVLLDEDFPRRGIGVSRVDTTDVAAVETAIIPATRAIFLETSTNPRLRIADLAAIAEVGHRRGLLVIADNTFLGPALLRPLEHGADLVVHAATKYLSGHGDAVSGVVSGAKALIDPIRQQTDTFGQAASPFSSFLVLRGVRTLPLRSRAGSDNAAAIASFLESHPKVAWVHYPGLDSHPDRAVARRLLGERAGAMVTFQPRGGLQGMAAFTDHLALCDIGVSLGDIHTLVYPRPKDGGIIRLSIGCEDVEDLIADFELGLSFVD